MKYLYIFILFLPLNLISNDWVHIDSLEVEGQHGSSKVQNIDCPDSSNCYAFLQETMYYMIKHSSDQGKSWELIYTADPWTEESPIQLNLLNTCSPGKDYLFLNMYESPIIKKSTDGGKTFKRIILDTLNTDDSRILSSLVMYDTNIGFAKNAHYWFVTNDGWETFKKYKNKKYGIYPDSYSSPFFIDSNTIGAWYSSHSYEERAQIFVEYNINKEVWTEKYMIPVDPPDSEYSQYLNDLCFVNDSIGFACGSQTTGVGDTSIDLIFRTTNGGETWERLWKELYDPKFGLNKIAAYDTKNVVAVGNFGKIVMTRDGGENWLIDTLPKLDQHIYRAMAPQITWAGQTPLIGTFYQGGGLYRYEGDFFDFSVEDTTNPDVITEAYANVRVRVRNSDRSMYISIDDEQFRNYELEIYDLNGVFRQKNDFQSGSGNVFRPVNIEGLKSGAYLYMVSCGGLPVRSGKFVVVR